MKCTNKFLILIITFIMASVLSGCGSDKIWMPYSVSDFDDTSFVENISDFSSETDNLLTPFADNLAVFSDNVSRKNFVLENAGSGLLIDVNNKEALFAQNAFQQMYPASITKILTALVAVKNCSLDEVITCTEAVEEIDVPGAVLLGLKKGDTLTLDQALRLALLSSYNDVATAIGVHVGGDINNFSEMMNAEALSLGASNSHFSNPTGLDNANHYTTAYDLYLIFNEAIKNPAILEIIQSKEYQTVYHDRNGNEITAYAVNSNQFFKGNYDTPENITIVGGKTGTTTDAGYCLMLLSRDRSSNPYIAVILNADSSSDLYTSMADLLKSIY